MLPQYGSGYLGVVSNDSVTERNKFGRSLLLRQLLHRIYKASDLTKGCSTITLQADYLDLRTSLIMKSVINNIALLASVTLFGATVQATCHADKYASRITSREKH